MSGWEQEGTRVPSSSTGEVATVGAGDGDLVGLPVVCDGQSLVVHSVSEDPIPMEMDPTAWLPFSGDLESVSGPSYAQVAAGACAIGLPPSASVHEQAGIQGVLRD